MNELRLTVGIPVSVNHYLAYRGVMKHGKPMAMSYKTKEALTYQKWLIGYLNAEVAKQGWSLVPDKGRHFYVDAVFYFPRVDMDANNYWKILLDAITDTGLIWLDDNVVCERVQRILYDTEDPRIELTIKPVDYTGIFDDVSQLERFESRCVGCRRYKRNCGLLAAAKAGKIQNGVTNESCASYKEI